MIISKSDILFLERRVVFAVLAGLILFPLKPMIGNSQNLFAPIPLESPAGSVGEFVAVDFLQKAKLEIQGKTSQASKDESESKDLAVKISKPVIEGPAEDKIAEKYSKREVITTVTAYNPVPEQTDSTPCITASGKNVCDQKMNVIAANWLPFGTKVQIPDYFGERVFEVQDRMNARYSDRVDVLMYDLAEAKEFGKRRLRVVVLD